LNTKNPQNANFNFATDKLKYSHFSTNQKPNCTMGENTIKYKDIFSTARIIYRDNGFLNGFYRGVVPRILCNAPSCAISWGAYEFMKHTLLKFKSSS